MSTLILGSYVHAHCLQMPTLPNSGQSVLAERYWSEHGGKGLNVGIGLKRLGEDTELLLPIGEDSAGQQIARELQHLGMDTRWLLHCGPQSGYGVGLIDEQGDNVIAVFPGANALLTGTMVERVLEQCATLQTVYAQLEIPIETVQAAFQAARTRGMRTVLNPSPWQALSADLLEITDILLLNEAEACALFGLSAEQAPSDSDDWLETLPKSAGAIGWRGEWLIVTLGAEGCIALGQRQLIHQRAWPINACDTTGAGDAFNAGLLWALKRTTITEALSIANACGAYVAGHSGVLQHLPDAATLQRFMAQHPQPCSRSIKQAC